MGKTKSKAEKIAEKTMSVRLALHAACRGDFSDKTVARELNRLLPGDTNRSRKLITWKEQGLWPVPQHELDKGSAQGAGPSNRPATDLPETSDEPDATIEAERPATTTESPMQDLTPLESDLSLSNTESEGELSTETETCNRPTIDDSAPTLPADLVELLTTTHERGDIEALLTWWKSEKGGSMGAAKRPRFTGRRVNSGLLVNEGLKNRAFARAKVDGMSLSQLVELLFWRYVGEPAEFVAHDE